MHIHEQRRARRASPNVINAHMGLYCVVMSVNTLNAVDTVFATVDTVATV